MSKKTERRKQARRKDTFTPKVSRITKKDVEETLSRSESRIEIRCPSEIKAEMETIAGRHGLTLTAYILRLHNLASSRLGEK